MLETPLEFRALPAALRVLVPAISGPHPIGLQALRRASIRRLWHIAVAGA